LSQILKFSEKKLQQNLEKKEIKQIETDIDTTKFGKKRNQANRN